MNTEKDKKNTNDTSEDPDTIDPTLENVIQLGETPDQTEEQKDPLGDKDK